LGDGRSPGIDRNRFIGRIGAVIVALVVKEDLIDLNRLKSGYRGSNESSVLGRTGNQAPQLKRRVPFAELGQLLSAIASALFCADERPESRTTGRWANLAFSAASRRGVTADDGAILIHHDRLDHAELVVILSE